MSENEKEDGAKINLDDKIKVNFFEIETQSGGKIKFNEEGAVALLQAYQMYVQITSEYFPKAHKSVMREMEHQKEINPDFHMGYMLFRSLENSELGKDTNG